MIERAEHQLTFAGQGIVQSKKSWLLGRNWELLSAECRGFMYVELPSYYDVLGLLGFVYGFKPRSI